MSLPICALSSQRTASSAPNGQPGVPSTHRTFGGNLSAAVKQHRDPQVVFRLELSITADVCHHQIATQPSRRQLHVRQCLVAQATPLAGQEDDLSPRH